MHKLSSTMVSLYFIDIRKTKKKKKKKKGEISKALYLNQVIHKQVRLIIVALMMSNTLKFILITYNNIVTKFILTKMSFWQACDVLN